MKLDAENGVYMKYTLTKILCKLIQWKISKKVV